MLSTERGFLTRFEDCDEISESLRLGSIGDIGRQRKIHGRNSGMKMCAGRFAVPRPESRMVGPRARAPIQESVGGSRVAAEGWPTVKKEREELLCAWQRVSRWKTGAMWKD